MAELTQQLLCSLLNYDSFTGLFTWRVRRNGTRGVGSVAGSVSKHGSKFYVKITINGKNYFAHRLAFLYTKGYYPSEVDHKNLNGMDNSWLNLRECTRTENNCNHALSVSNTSGCKGVYFDKRTKKWYVQVFKNNLTYNFGSFDKYEDACVVSVRERKRLHNEFARN